MLCFLVWVILAVLRIKGSAGRREPMPTCSRLKVFSATSRGESLLSPHFSCMLKFEALFANGFDREQ